MSKGAMSGTRGATLQQKQAQLIKLVHYITCPWPSCFSSLLLSVVLRMIQNHETISRQRGTSGRPTVTAFKGDRKKKRNTLECCCWGDEGREGRRDFHSWKGASKIGSHVEKLHCASFLASRRHMTGPVSGLMKRPMR